MYERLHRVAQQRINFAIELSNPGHVTLSVKSFFVCKIGGQRRYMVTALSMVSDL